MDWSDRKALECADRVQARDYVGWVVWPGRHENRRFFRSIEALMHAAACEDVNLPPFVWPAVRRELTLAAPQVVQAGIDASSERYYSAGREVPEEALAALQEVLDAWLKRSDVCVDFYEENLRLAIVFDGADRARYEQMRAEVREHRRAVWGASPSGD